MIHRGGRRIKASYLLKQENSFALEATEFLHPFNNVLMSLNPLKNSFLKYRSQ